METGNDRLSQQIDELVSIINHKKYQDKYQKWQILEFISTRILTTFLEPICRNNKASLVNMLVKFCGKLECSFLAAKMLFLYLHFSTTAKVPRPKA